MVSWIKRRLVHERGSVLAMTAILMVPMLGFAAFAIDMGNWYQARQSAPVGGRRGGARRFAGPSQQLEHGHHRRDFIREQESEQQRLRRVGLGHDAVQQQFQSDQGHGHGFECSEHPRGRPRDHVGVGQRLGGRPGEQRAAVPRQSSRWTRRVRTTASTVYQNGVVINGNINTNGNFETRATAAPTRPGVVWNGSNGCSPNWGRGSYTSNVDSNTTSSRGRSTTADRPTDLQFQYHRLKQPQLLDRHPTPPVTTASPAAGATRSRIGTITCIPCTFTTRPPAGQRHVQRKRRDPLPQLGRVALSFTLRPAPR